MSDVLMTVATFGDPVEANLAKNYLEASGVQAFLADEETVNMDWALGNAIGRIKLQVGDQDADAARTLLSQHNDLAATAALGPEEIRYETSQDEPTPRWEDLDEDGDQDQDQEADDFEPEPTTRDKNAERAFKGAIFGLLFFRSSSTRSTYCSRSSSPMNRSATASGGRRLLPESSIYP